ncbi:uncharacterized protein V1510DRAFT_357200, partial [Dipodascopsis tothii]|uniref:uncharacterized protein n=1 Tax=Dipodascopsis tothii TaxID=44089 RepID=UPI0034CD5798
RGDGRYFGRIEDNHDPICMNCHEPGHIASECRMILCQTCGEKDDHTTARCPKTLRCNNCNKLGHDRSQCNETKRDIYCSRCRSTRHAYENCPSVWRCYSLSHKPLKEVQTLYCYNCARSGHYGDDCNAPRLMNMRKGDDSAFCRANLPQ